MNNLANLRLKTGESREAENLLRTAILVQPKFAAAWMNLGLALLDQKRFIVSIRFCFAITVKKPSVDGRTKGFITGSRGKF